MKQARAAIAGLAMQLLWLAVLYITAARGHACSVAVDVGHSRARPGAISARGVAEFDFNLALATRIGHALQRDGCNVLLVGDDGNMRELKDRTAKARDAGFFLAIHHDSVQAQFLRPWTHNQTSRLYSDRFAGFSLFVSRNNPDPARSVHCASTIGAALRAKGFVPSLYHAQEMPGEHRPFADKKNGVHYFDNLVVLKTAMQPAVLLEAGVIVNRDEETRLASAATQQKIAEAVSSAIGLCMGGTRMDH
jgi:N-acetylmuramoyl-L-alanine amidase